jgi:hypothetical protein
LSGPNLLKWLAALTPALPLGAECGFAYALVWVIACLMVALSLSESAWVRR